MKFELVKGNKGENDLITKVATDGFEQIKYSDLFKLIKLFYVNEDKIYPPPCKGSKMLLEAFEYLRSHTIEETLEAFGINT